MKRIHHKKIFIVSILLVVFLPAFDAAFSEPSSAVKEPAGGARATSVPSSIGEAFAGEELTYQISILVFRDAAISSLVLKKEADGGYTATLIARTSGVINKVYHRQDTYVTRMNMTPDGRRFVFKTFEKTVDINGKVRRGITVMDYERGLMTWQARGGGKPDKDGIVHFKPHTYYDDPLAGFYNFRYGVYGKAAEGGVYRIPTFPKEGRSPEIYLRINTRPEFEKRAENRPYADFLADVQLDKELFTQGSGALEIFFTAGMVPVEAVAKDVVFFGDVRGRLKGLGMSMGLKKTAEAR